MAQTGAVCTPPRASPCRSGILPEREAPAVPDRSRNRSSGQFPETAAAERTDAATVNRMEVSALRRIRTTDREGGERDQVGVHPGRGEGPRFLTEELDHPLRGEKEEQGEGAEEQEVARRQAHLADLASGETEPLLQEEGSASVRATAPTKGNISPHRPADRGMSSRPQSRNDRLGRSRPTLR